MSFNGSGTFVVNSSGQPVVTATVISSSVFNALTADLATGLSTCVTKDGQTTPTANIPMGGFKITGLATATATGDALSYGNAAVFSFTAADTVVAAGTTNLATSAANRQTVTGGTTITSFGSATNSYRILTFTGAPLLTYNATTLITPTGANIQAGPGDVATLSSDGSGNWKIISYEPYGGVLEQSTLTNTLTSAVSQVGAVALTPGKWRLTATALYSGTAAIPSFSMGIGATTASFTGTVNGKSSVTCALDATGGVGGGAISGFDVTVTATTNYFLNASVPAGTATSSLNAYIRAERII